ncbi:hypothetical protein ACS0TY_005599 [Phlomoides rotata]
MDDLYTFTNSSISYPHHHLVLESPHDQHGDIIKAQIASHPLYPTLLSAYIDCTKVGAPPEMASLLDEISKEENHHISATTQMGIDPELDDFMKSYCEALHKYKEELSKPFDEATNFLSTIQSQLTDLCKQALQSTTYSSQSPDDWTWEEDMMSCGAPRQGDEEEEVKEMLMRKYSGYLSSLRKEFFKKRKKGKLPKDAISLLLDWWNTHYRWPYPTEDEKNKLSELGSDRTGSEADKQLVHQSEETTLETVGGHEVRFNGRH